MRGTGKLIWSVALAVLFCASLVAAQEYVGSAACGNCHPGKYADWQQSGHHHALTRITGAAPQFPFQYHPGSPNVPAPPSLAGTPLSWNQISYVAGGYHRKANFADAQGYLITGAAGDQTQWNVWGENWVPYHPGQSVDFDCAQCHATGYSPAGHQGGLPGAAGIWAEDGVGCEGCHGPDS
ncbi:MAG: hypothetical protein C4524_09635 [Candidatus Zixiibacteriota bacterium]|nr:MAG: hypothetical protein C4524_09635 [candidate division Zixibacteria bacterium]